MPSTRLRDVIARGVFTSVTDLRRELMRYIEQYNETAKPFRWPAPIRRVVRTLHFQIVIVMRYVRGS